MRKIVYHVATTVDHYICHEDGSIDGFLPDGEHVPDYLETLKTYDTVIMGKNTYTFGYAYGLQPGQPAYAHMMHYIFSKTLKFDGPTHKQVEIVRSDELNFVKALKMTEGSDIYLCGGGAFAGFLLDHELVDQVILKVNPVLFGKGIPLFGGSSKRVPLKLMDSKVYQNGVLLLTYDLEYLQND